jgi:A/G-specific adenine glycosylase
MSDQRVSPPGDHPFGVVLDWYGSHARDLPWRRPDASPWAVLVSEIMLQQTQVARVEPVWHDWMARWPTPAALAADSAGEAVRMWGRLGYPRRALRLHECAVALVERHGGEVPDSVEELLALPGIGAYTARAVVAFAYRRREPVVDTNVRRLVSRAVAGVADAPPGASRRDQDLVEPLLPADGETAATLSVGLMELGALVCTARRPRCADCPLAGVCAWRAAGRPAPTNGRVRRRQRYVGTDRQVRGRLLAVLRDADGPVPRAALDAVWDDHTQRDRALATLVEDGLVVPLADGRYALPG